MNSKPPVEPHGTTPQGTLPPAGPATPGPLLNLQIVWGGMLVAIGFYVGFGFFASAQLGALPTADAAQLGVLELVFSVTALGCLVASYLLPKKLLQQAMDKEDPATIDLRQRSVRCLGRRLRRRHPALERRCLVEQGAIPDEEDPVWHLEQPSR